MPRRHIFGRPPAGLRGEKTTQYPQLAIRVPPQTMTLLHVLSAVQHVPIWRVVMDAIMAYGRKHRAD